MATSAAQASMATAGNRPLAAASSSGSQDLTNGHGDSTDSPASTAPPATAAAKKGKKKAADQNETGKLLAAKINQLELDAAGEKDQEAEIGTYQLWRPTARSASLLLLP